MLDLLRKIKKLKVKELIELEVRLKIIHQQKRDDWVKLIEQGKFASSPIIDFNDLDDALTYCIYHFTGQRYDNELDTEFCPCRCLCENCELIPTNEIGITMQKMGQDLREENVIFEGFKKGHFKTLKDNHGS